MIRTFLWEKDDFWNKFLSLLADADAYFFPETWM